MKFQDAIEAMRNGKNVRRKGSYIRLHHNKNEFVDHNHEKVNLSPYDLFKDDWEIVE